jgi:apyrase
MFDAGSSGTRVFVYSWSCRENKTMAYINITEKTLEYKV